MTTNELAASYVESIKYLLATEAPLPPEAVKNSLISMVMHALASTRECMEMKRRIAALEVQLIDLQRKEATSQ